MPSKIACHDKAVRFFRIHFLKRIRWRCGLCYVKCCRLRWSRQNWDTILQGEKISKNVEGWAKVIETLTPPIAKLIEYLRQWLQPP